MCFRNWKKSCKHQSQVLNKATTSENIIEQHLALLAEYRIQLYKLQGPLSTLGLQGKLNTRQVTQGKLNH